MKKLLTTLMSAALLVSAAPVLAADTFTIDPVHSHANFKIMHMNAGYQYGRFNDFEGTVVVDEKTPANSKVEVTVKTDSIDTKNGKRDEHLRSADFFDAKQFPTLSFKSTKVEAAGKDTYKVTGNLTLHGVTKLISFTFKKTGEGKNQAGKVIFGGETTFTINRNDYGISYMPGGLGDDVTIMLSFEGVKN